MTSYAKQFSPRGRPPHFSLSALQTSIHANAAMTQKMPAVMDCAVLRSGLRFAASDVADNAVHASSTMPFICFESVSYDDFAKYGTLCHLSPEF